MESKAAGEERLVEWGGALKALLQSLDFVPERPALQELAPPHSPSFLGHLPSRCHRKYREACLMLQQRPIVEPGRHEPGSPGVIPQLPILSASRGLRSPSSPGPGACTELTKALPAKESWAIMQGPQK